MGNFYTNITVVGGDSARIASWLDGAHRAAFVGTWDGHTVVFDRDGEAQDGSHTTLAAELSAVLDSPAIAVLNHDDDVLMLDVFDAGTLRGSYNSCPDYFGDDDDDDESGSPSWSLDLDPAAIVALVGRGDAGALATVMGGDELFAIDLHAAIVEELGLPDAAVGLGYRYLDQGDVPESPATGGLRHVGGPDRT